MRISPRNRDALLQVIAEHDDPRRGAAQVPCTTTLRGLSYQPRMNLARPSVATCDHVKSVSRDRLVELLPVVLSKDEIAEVRFAVRRMFA